MIREGVVVSMAESEQRDVTERTAAQQEANDPCTERTRSTRDDYVLVLEVIHAQIVSLQP